MILAMSTNKRNFFVIMLEIPETEAPSIFRMAISLLLSFYSVRFVQIPFHLLEQLSTTEPCQEVIGEFRWLYILKWGCHSLNVSRQDPEFDSTMSF